jgi:hypothetical protein
LIASGTAVSRPAPPTGQPPSVQRLMSCRAIADSAQRLQCYDREVVGVDQAIAKKEVVMIDKAKATAAKRSLFGFSVPDFGGLFGGDDDQVKEIASTVTGFGRNADGGWIVRLADGSTWSQTDDAMLGLPPERGQKVVVHKGSFGNFFLRLNGQPGFRAKRVG